MTYCTINLDSRPLFDSPAPWILEQLPLRATLEDDILRCRWALYHGTTAIVHAVVAGLRPIYLQLTGEMTIDRSAL